MKAGFRIALLLALAPGLLARPAAASISDLNVSVTPTFANQLGDLQVDISFKTSFEEDLVDVTAVLEGAFDERDYASELVVTCAERTVDGDTERRFECIGRPTVDGFLLLPPGSYTLLVTVATTFDVQAVGVLLQVAVPDIPTLQQVVSRMAAVRPAPGEPTYIDGSRSPRLVNHLQRLLAVAQNALTNGGTGEIDPGAPRPKVAARRIRNFRSQVIAAERKGIINPDAALVLKADAVQLITQISPGGAN